MKTKIANLLEVLVLWGVVGGVVFSLFYGLSSVRGNALGKDDSFADEAIVYQDNSLSANSAHYIPSGTVGSLFGGEDKTYRVAITGYSSSPYETDSSPYITASGDWVQDGVVAANFLSFGTKFKIPELFGDKIFTVQDRMHPRKRYQVDIWFPSRTEALEFGAHYSYIELVDET